MIIDKIKQINPRWVYGIAIIAGPIVMFIMFKGCDTAPSNKEDKKVAKIEKKEIAAASVDLKYFIDSMNVENRKKDKSLDSLRHANYVLSTKILEKTVQINQNAADYEKAKLANDTEAKNKACEDLIANAKIQEQNHIQYVQKTDSTIALLGEKLNAKDTIIAALQSFNVKMRGAYDNSEDRYAKLDKDYRKVSFKYKAQQGVSKVGTIAGFIAGVAVGCVIKNNVK